MNPLRLRVDVCTYRGLRDGVPGVLDVLRQAKARATFFVTFGPDASGLALLRLLNPKFALKMLRTKAASTYGWATAFYGTLLPSPLVGAGLPDTVRRIRDEGHEIGLHGWDHRRWQDRLPKYDAARLRDEFSRMTDAYRSILGTAPDSFAAPAWLLTRDLFDLEQQAGLRFGSDTRGRSPFLPVFLGKQGAVPQYPVTLATLDECLGRMSPEDFVEESLRESARQPEYSCFTAHAESEGMGYKGVLQSLLTKLGRPVGPLGETRPATLPAAEVRLGRVDGRPYDVCLQAP
ncbi:MAG TPA: polysaccharide deacetylase family protein [Planctomycetota bacterium]|nr:polysaccharide deacetylase family protein [Planctomycetota bacterium]